MATASATQSVRRFKRTSSLEPRAHWPLRRPLANRMEHHGIAREGKALGELCAATCSFEWSAAPKPVEYSFVRTVRVRSRSGLLVWTRENENGLERCDVDYSDIFYARWSLLTNQEYLNSHVTFWI